VRSRFAVVTLLFFGMSGVSPLLAVAQSAPVTRAAREPQAAYRFAAALFGLDPRLLKAIASVESGGDTSAVSPKGAQGVMQLMPDTARQFGVRNPFNPVQNIVGAAGFLAFLRWWQLGQPGHPADLADMLAAYNAGPGTVQKYGGVPPFPETQDYVRRVLIRYLFGTAPVGLRRAIEARAAFSQQRGLAARRSAASAAKADPMDQLAEIRRMRARARQRQVESAVTSAK
jgi:soluble lytic murein transglycosylase-like protein